MGRAFATKITPGPTRFGVRLRRAGPDIADATARRAGYTVFAGALLLFLGISESAPAM